MRIPQMADAGVDFDDGEAVYADDFEEEGTKKEVTTATKNELFQIYTLKDQTNKKLVKRSGDVNGNPFVIRNLKNCHVNILDRSLSIDVENLDNCYVFIGPCEDALQIKNCNNCEFVATCRAFRALCCNDCSFFLHTETDPIVENCKHLTFGPFTASDPNDYKDFERHCKLANLLVDSMKPNNNYANVYDLNAGKDETPDWVVIQTGALVDPANQKLTPFARHKLKFIFREFDQSLNGSLSKADLISYKNATRSLQDVDVNMHTNISFNQFCKFYEERGPDALATDLEALNIDPLSFSYYIRTTGERYQFKTSVLPLTPSDLTDVSLFEVAIELLRQANKSGINIVTWFKNFDDSNAGTLSADTFKNAFSGLLLGLCAAKPGEFTDDVHDLLSPQSLETIVEFLRVETDRDKICYRSLISNATTDERLQQHKMLRVKVEKYKPLFSSNKKNKYFDPSLGIEDQVTNYVMNSDNVEKTISELLSAINFWKWSKGGLSPTVNGRQHGPEGETISVSNLSKAFVSLGFSVSLVKVQKFKNIILSGIETKEERKARYRRHGKEKAEDEISIAAIMRWLHSKRVQTLKKDLSYVHWVQSKQLESAQLDKLMKSKLEDALFDGNLSSLIYLCLPENESLLTIMIENTYGNDKNKLIPEKFVESEITGEVDDFLYSAEGMFTIRRRAIRNIDGQATSFNMRKEKANLRKETIEKIKGKWNKGFCQHKKLILSYGRDKKRGQFYGSFLKWLEQRHNFRTLKRKKLRSWEKKKREMLWCQKEGNRRLSVAKTMDVVDFIRGLVNKTYIQNQDKNTGIVTCRSSRYQGLDPEYYYARMRKLENSGSLYIFRHDFHQVFDGLLRVLATDPRTSKQAQEILYPCATVQKKIEKLQLEDETVDGEMFQHSDFKDMIWARQQVKAEIQELELSEKVVHAMALEVLRNKYEDEIYAQVGFRQITNEEEKDQLINVFKERKSAKCKSNVNVWLKQKDAIERKAKKEESQAKKQKRITEKEKEKKVRKNVRKWKRGLSRRKKESKAVEAKNKLLREKRPAWVGLGAEIEITWDV